ncbi:amidohydrolase family protein [Sphingomonas bacterium]|uniref:amidohydrolase family protein n=1 Tax=Sphingomonas bacterium TaxID=1895847 RepID=UPI00157775C4|nr:amidohydrolase family protein [Sphingomonas bacterium]
MATVTPLRASKPTARDLLGGIKVIDVDTHISEPHDLWTSRAPARLKPMMPRIAGEGADRKWVIGDNIHLATRSANSAIMRDGSKIKGMDFMQIEVPDVHAGASNVFERVKMMDEQGIHAQIAYPNVLGFGGQRAMKVDEELRVASIRIFNDAMADVQKDSGQRIFPMALLPWWDVEKAVQETERCLKLGLKGININSDPQDHGLPSLGERHWDRLWEACTANDIPVNFHIGASDSSSSWYFSSTWPERNESERLAMGGLMLFIGNLRVVANILLSRFLERHPKLKVVSVESGAGWIPYLLEALEYMSGEAGIDYSPSPTEVFNRQIYACTFFERKNFVQTIRQVGADNIMFETDFPHPACLYPDGLDYMVDAIAEMTVEERFKIFSGNAARVYNLDIS